MKGGFNNEGAKTQGKTWSLRGCVLVGVFVGAMFSVLPMELVVLGVPLALGMGLLFCWPASRRYRLKGYVPTVAIALAVMVCAAYLPTKTFDRPVDPFPSTVITLGDLIRRGLAYNRADWEPGWTSIRVELPTHRPTRRQILDSINQQTPVRASIRRCGVGATLAFGSSFGRISLSEPTNIITQATP